MALWKAGFESFTPLRFDVNYRKYTINPIEQNVGNSISRDERSVGLDAGAGILNIPKTAAQREFSLILVFLGHHRYRLACRCPLH